MRNNKKVLLISSVSITIILFVAYFIKIQEVKFANEELAKTLVQDNLVKLEGLLSHQKNSWKSPNRVVETLSDVLYGIETVLLNREYTHWISNDDREALKKLHFNLYQYPKASDYADAELNKEDKRKLEELAVKLREAGWGMKIPYGSDWREFIQKVEKLSDLLKV